MCFDNCGFEVCGECVLQDVNFVDGNYVKNVYDDFKRRYGVTPCYAGGRIESGDPDGIVVSEAIADEYASVRREYIMLCRN